MKRKNGFLFVLFATLTAICLCLSGCANEQAAAETGKPVIAVTIVPQKAFAEAVCGDLADVITMVPPGSSPENYEPTPQQMKLLEKAALYFAIGVPTEEANILPALESIETVKVIALQDKVAEVYPDRTFASGERDPHIWLSPKRVRIIIETITREMSELAPENKQAFMNNAEAYLEQLDELDREINQLLQGAENRKFIVYHPAFGYFADDYGLQMIALEEEGKEATIRRLQEMIDFAKAENIKAVFYQEEIDSSQSEAFAEEISGRTVQLAPLAADYIDNLKKMAETIGETIQ